MQLGIGLVFAVLLTFMKKHVTFVKTLYYVPCIITTVAIAQLFRSMYATEPMGLINQFFQAIGMEGMVTSWLANIHTALMAVSVPEGWRFTGMYMVIFYAALISLDPSVYEAAKVDGATDFQILLKIKLPLIKDIILLTLTMCLTGALRGFDIPFLLTSGGPGNASELLSTYMYKKAFSNNQYGLSLLKVCWWYLYFVKYFQSGRSVKNHEKENWKNCICDSYSCLSAYSGLSYNMAFYGKC